MNAKEQATKDIKEELKKTNRSFIAFRKELNPVMRVLVSEQIKNQLNCGSLFKPNSQSNAQLMARCFYSKGETKFENYSIYYKIKP